MAGQAGFQGRGQPGQEQQRYWQPSQQATGYGQQPAPQMATGYGQHAQPTGLVAMGQPLQPQSGPIQGSQAPGAPPSGPQGGPWGGNRVSPTLPRQNPYPSIPPFNPGMADYPGGSPGADVIWDPMPRRSPWDPTGQSVFGSGQPAQQPQNYANSDEWMMNIMNGTPRRGVRPQPAPFDPTGQNVFGSGIPGPRPPWVSDTVIDGPGRSRRPQTGERWTGLGTDDQQAYQDRRYDQWNQDERYGNMTRPVPGRPNWVTQGGLGGRLGSQGLSGLMGRR